MTDNLFSNLTEYLSQLEARVAQLEARNTALATALAAAEARIAAIEETRNIDDILARIEDLEHQEPIGQAVTTETVQALIAEALIGLPQVKASSAIDEETGLPEVEVELLTDEDVEADEEVEAESPVEPEEEPMPKAEPETPAPIAESAPAEEPEPEVPIEDVPAAEPETPAPAAESAPVAATGVGLAPKLTDLKKGISLGDRFLFQRELFGGNGELMTKTIVTLNEMSTMEEADAYIKKNFQWSADSHATELFYNLLKRKF